MTTPSPAEPTSRPQVTRLNREDGSRELVDFGWAAERLAARSGDSLAEVEGLLRQGVRLATAFAFYRVEPLSPDVMAVVESVGLHVGHEQRTPRYPISISGRGMMTGRRLFADEAEVLTWLEEEWGELEEVAAFVRARDEVRHG